MARSPRIESLNCSDMGLTCTLRDELTPAMAAFALLIIGPASLLSEARRSCRIPDAHLSPQERMQGANLFKS